jgi:hypothetical protein
MTNVKSASSAPDSAPPLDETRVFPDDFARVTVPASPISAAAQYSFSDVSELQATLGSLMRVPAAPDSAARAGSAHQ